MVSWRYEISLLVLKKYFTRIFHLFNTQREISYLRAILYIHM